MRKLPRPTQAAGDVYTLCISNVRSRALRERLQSVKSNVVAAAQTYATNAAVAALHSFPRSDTVGRVTKEEMTSVYTVRMVPRTQPGRSVYDALIAGAPRGRCPLCGVGQVSTLDHHLPKAEYPILTVTPLNLVPACTWCQTSKKEGYPLAAEEQTLHPYFDDFEGERWLGAVIRQSAPATFVFIVTPPAGWTDLNAARVRRHIKVFKLDQLFASNAADELINIRLALQQLHDAGGVAAVQAHLKHEADSREHAFRNSWQTAMYRAAEACQWFCDGGFSLE